jgi:hypothetical protein
MQCLRRLGLALLAVSLVVGCGPKKPDTDPSVDELQTPNVEEGGGESAGGGGPCP